MPNPPDSKWFATPRAARNRKPLSVTLSDEARAKLEALAEAHGFTLSAAVEALVLKAKALPLATAVQRVDRLIEQVTREPAKRGSKKK